ncbi:MAG: MMPL family transporter [Chitinophagales bacterium]|nr:MMPL family transporter [Chitinophagales bacterium]
MKFRIPLFVVLCASTLFMAYMGAGIHMDYAMARIIPEDNPKYLEFKAFQKQFGQESNVLVLAVEGKRLNDYHFYNQLLELGTDIEKVEGMESAFSIATVYDLVKDADAGKFKVVPVHQGLISSQAEMDSIWQKIESLPFYKNLLYNPQTHVALVAVRFDEKELESKGRLAAVKELENIALDFEQRTGAVVHLSGLPFIRNNRMAAVSNELVNITIYAVIVLALVLLFLFRSVSAVVYPFVIVAIGVAWAMGLQVLFDFKITILTALVPTLIIIIGIPNCVYMLNKYHTEYKKHGDKLRALTLVIERIGSSSLFANVTTAIGFGVFYLTHSVILQEFGILSGIMICLLYLISVVSLPILLSFMPPPKVKHMVHLERNALSSVIETFIHISTRHRKWIYTGSALILLVSAFGILRLSSRGFILDDVPKDSQVYKDMKFLERHFTGVMPLEITIDTKRKGGAMSASTLRKIDEVQDSLEASSLFSKPTSIVNGLKFATQAFYNGNPNKYRLPASSGLTPEMGFISRYLTNMDQSNGVGQQVLGNYMDSSRQVARISVQIPDIGSDKLDSLYHELDRIVLPVFDTADYKVTYTGTSIVAMEGFRYISDSLTESVIISLILVGLVMAYLFRNPRTLIISLIPNLIPLCLTAGIMGYFGITLKPSTVLIFSVSFGLSSDFTIYFLSKYKLELLRHEWDIFKGIVETLRETGISMIYTALILFFGFITFYLSDFEGTKNMGLLISITLASSLFSNMVLLPALLVSFDKIPRRQLKRMQQKSIDEPIH